MFMFKNNEEDTPMFPGSQSLQSEKFKSFSQKLKQVDHSKMRPTESQLDKVDESVDKALLIQDTPSPKIEHNISRDNMIESGVLANEFGPLSKI